MKPLEKQFVNRLEEIKQDIQESELLEEFLEEETEENFRRIESEFEPRVAELYEEVADGYPLQLLALEKELLDPDFEGLYLPKILGYSVLRGVVNENYKYKRPQEHFGEVLLAICTSNNFDYLKKRMGQTVQIGFALSSDIWVSNLIEKVPNKIARRFLKSQKREKYMDFRNRKTGYVQYSRQFRDYNFYTTEFPKKKSQLKTYYPQLKDFLINRIRLEKDDSSFYPELVEFATNEEFEGMEFIYIFGLILNYFAFEGSEKTDISQALNHRREEEGFVGTYFEFLRELLYSDRLKVYPECDQRVSDFLDKRVSDDLTKYYKLTDIIHGKGYVHQDTIDAIRKFYYQHGGLSVINECVRMTILNYFRKVIYNLDVDNYEEYFDFFKIISTYVQIFSNQKFNQKVKDISLVYIHRLLDTYTNKRAKDYQTIKKFVQRNFLELGLMREKELKDLFKTKRKRKRKKK